MRPLLLLLGLLIAAAALPVLDGTRLGRGTTRAQRVDTLDAEGLQAAPGVVWACEDEDQQAAVPCPFTGYAQRLDAARELAGGGPESRAALRAALGDPWPSVRAAAAFEILDSTLADKDDLACLEGLLGDDADLSVRFAAALSLARLSEPSWGEAAAARALHADALVQRARLRDIVAALQQGPEPARADALRILALMHADQGVAMEPGGMLVQNVPALAKLVVEVLTDLLDSDLRGFAIQVLGRCGPEAADVVGRLDLSRGDDFDRHAVAVALLRQETRLDEALPILAKEIVEEDENNLCRRSPEPEEWRPLIPLLRGSLAGSGPIHTPLAVRVVWRLGPEAAPCVPDLVHTCDSPDLAGLAVCAIGRIGSPAAAAVHRLAADIEAGRTYSVDPRYIPESDLGRFAPFVHGPPPGPLALLDDVGAPLFEQFSEAPDIALRAAARVAPRDPSVVRAALGRLDDPREEVRDAAVLVLRDAIAAGDIPPDAVAARLVRDPSEDVRRRAATVLSFAARGRTEVASCLSDLLEHGDDYCRQCAARALRRAGAEQALVKALDSKSLSSRRWAAAALVGFAQSGFMPIPPKFAEDEDPPCESEEAWRSKAVEILDGSLRAEDPALRRLAVHVIGSWPELFPDCEHVLATAANDPDEDVRNTAWLFSRRLEWRNSYAAADDPPAEREPAIRDLVARMRGEGPWTPIDVACLVESGALDAKPTLAKIVADETLDPFERWIAARSLAR